MIRISPNFTANKIAAADKNSKIKDEKNISNPIAENSEMPAVVPDYSVKTPMPYQKISEFKLPFDLNASLYKFANGQRVVIIPKEGKTVLKTYVNTGSMNENDKIRGISHYIEHNLFNGSEELEAGEFFKKVDKMGASTNASTGFSETNYFITSNLLNQNDLEDQIKIHASMLETPRFAAEMLEKEKGIVNSEINMITSDPLNVGINKALKNLYQIDTKSLDMIGGTTSNITNLTRDDVVNYFNENYYPANMVTVVTGDVKPDETMKLLSKYFTSKKQPSGARYFENLKPISKPVREDIISDKATAASVILAFDGPKNNDAEEKILTQALAQILTMSKTSRIDKKLKNLNSSAFTEIERISSKPDASRSVFIVAEGSEKNSEAIIKTIYNEISRIAAVPPSEDELNVVKKRMLKDFSAIFERSALVNTVIGSAFQDNDLNLVTNYEKIVNSLTPEKISEAASKYMDLNRASLTVVHPQSATEESIKANHTAASNINFTGSEVKKQAINMDRVKEYKLNNNFSLVLQDSNNNNARFSLSYENDKFPEYVKPGTVQLLSKILNSGTINKNEQEFQSELDKLSIETGFGAGAADLNIQSNFFAEDIESALKSAKEVLQNPRFTQEALLKVKSELRDELETSEKEADDKLTPEILKGLPIGYSKQEILKSLDDVTIDDLKSLYNFIIENGQANIIISAPFSRKPELKQILFNEISELPEAKEKNSNLKNIYSDQSEMKILTDIHSKPQAQIVKAYKFKINQNLKDEISLELLNTILGGNPSSRLFQDLRENQKLAYSVRSNLSLIDDIGVLDLRIGTTTENKDTGEVSFDNLQKSVEGFNKHIEKMKTEKVSDEELANAKLKLKNILLNSTETDSGKNGLLHSGLVSPYGTNLANEMLKAVDDVTVDDIYNAANYIFSGKPVYSILATENTLNENKEFLDKLSQ